MQALSIQNLRKVYAGGVTALNDVNLNVSEGDFFGLLGPNGAGKTTIIGIICSLVIKTGGPVNTVKYSNPEVDALIDKAASMAGNWP